MMNSDDVITMYESVCELTGKMLDAARARDWDQLIELETDWSGRFQSLQAGEPLVPPLSGESRARKVAIIHRILAHDREIRDLTTPWMAELSELINTVGTQRKLHHAYGAQPG